MLSPCGYALLPAYIVYMVGGKASTGRALLAGLAATFGLITLYGMIGLAVSVIGRGFAPYIPILTLPAALIILTMGFLMLLNLRFPALGLKGNLAVRLNQTGLVGSYLFGFSYGLSASGCTAPIFLSILSFAIGSGSDGFLVFAFYAAGVAIPLIITSILVAQAKQDLIMRIQGLTAKLHTLAGVGLILGGLYLLYYTYTSRIPILVSG